MEVSGQLRDPAAFSGGKSLQCPLHKRLGGPQNRSARASKKKNPCYCRESNSSHPVREPRMYFIHQLGWMIISLNCSLSPRARLHSDQF